MNKAPLDSGDLVIITPVFNDWVSTKELLDQLGNALQGKNLVANVLIVNDGSSHPPPPDLGSCTCTAIEQIDLLDLNCNLGHQRAIAVGLVHAAAHTNAKIMVIMDSDGEDKPADVPRLIEYLITHPKNEAVFAGRHRRTESLVFRLGYVAYWMMHLLLTGVRIRFGNFSAILASAVHDLVYQDALWNHYAAAVIRSRITYSTIPTARGVRYEGESKQNILQLMIHGFSALSVFSAIVCCRLFTMIILLLMLATAGLLYGVMFGQLSIPILALVLSAGLTLLLSFILSVIALVGLRSIPAFVPARDATVFVREISKIKE